MTRWVCGDHLLRHRPAKGCFETLRHLGEALIGGRIWRRDSGCGGRCRRRGARLLNLSPLATLAVLRRAAAGDGDFGGGTGDLVGEARKRVGGAHRANVGNGRRGGGGRLRGSVPDFVRCGTGIADRLRHRFRLQRPGRRIGAAARSAAGFRLRRSVQPVPRGSRRPCRGSRLVSTTTSVGPPIINRCSTLSRRMMTSLRRPSTAAESTTASRGCRPRAAASICAAPNRRTSQAAAPISSRTKTNAMMKFTEVGSSTPKRLLIDVPLRRSAPAGRSACHPQKWLTPPAIIAVQNINKELTPEGDFGIAGPLIPICLVNGRLMANQAFSRLNRSLTIHPAKSAELNPEPDRLVAIRQGKIRRNPRGLEVAITDLPLFSMLRTRMQCIRSGVSVGKRGQSDRPAADSPCSRAPGLQRSGSSAPRSATLLVRGE